MPPGDLASQIRIQGQIVNLDENLTLAGRRQRCGLQTKVLRLRYAVGPALQNHLCDIRHIYCP